MSIVVDFSVVTNWIMPAASSPFADDILERVALDGANIPPVFRTETGNVLVVAVRRKRIAPDVRHMAFDLLSKLPLKEDASGAAHIWTHCMDIADRHGLSLYDATYLELAIRLSKPLATLDGRLAEAARFANTPSPWRGIRRPQD